MSRSLCHRCGYPSSVCLCAAVNPLSCKSQIIILQHPSEQNVAKATVPLIKLALPDCRVYQGETEADFQQVKVELEQSCSPTVVIYPEDDAITLPNFAQQVNANDTVNLIFIDGTWRKAHKIRQLNPWLAQFPFATFSELPRNQYILRKAKRPDSISTLESVALSLSIIEEFDPQPLYHLLDALMSAQLQAMPAQVKQRYNQN